MAIEKRREYKDYEEYVQHQSEKTSRKRLRSKLQRKYEGRKAKFISRFKPLVKNEIIVKDQKALCLGARMGEEVAALNELGLNAIGVDLVENLPLVVSGDFNDLQFAENSFDVVYSNSFDHAWETNLFFDNIDKVIKDDGYLILDLMPTEKNYGSYEVMCFDRADDIVEFVTKYGFKLVQKSNKLPQLYRGGHKDVQIVLHK